MQNDPPVQASPAPPVVATKSSTGLDENVAALLAYIVHLITGVIFFVIEKNSRLVRFHAMQSIILSGVWFVGMIAIWIIGLILAMIFGYISAVLGTIVWGLMTLLWFVFGIAAFIGWILCMIKAYQGQYFKLPVIGNFAEKFSQK